MWTGYEFEFREKTSDWFWAVGIIIASVSAISVIYQNYIFGLFFILAGGMLMLTARNMPRLIDYEVTADGIRINDRLYPHIDFKSFYIVESKHSAPKLLLRTGSLANPILIIGIETDYVNPKDVRDLLLNYIPEIKMQEPLSVRLMEMIGF